MPTDKIIQIDLTALTQESLGKLIKIKEEIVNATEKKPKKQSKKEEKIFQEISEEDSKTTPKVKKSKDNYYLVSTEEIPEGNEITLNYKDTPWFINKNTDFD